MWVYLWNKYLNTEKLEKVNQNDNIMSVNDEGKAKSVFKIIETKNVDK